MRYKKRATLSRAYRRQDYGYVQGIYHDTEAYTTEEVNIVPCQYVSFSISCGYFWSFKAGTLGLLYKDFNLGFAIKRNFIYITMYTISTLVNRNTFFKCWKIYIAH